jgi:hypothetical protein
MIAARNLQRSLHVNAIAASAMHKHAQQHNKENTVKFELSAQLVRVA